MKKPILLLLLRAMFSDICEAQNTWTQKAAFPGAARRSAIGFSFSSAGYMGTGYSGNFYDDLWKYDPVSNSWSPCASFPGTARFSAVAFLANGFGFVGTGYDVLNTFQMSDFWKYDPFLNSWTQVADMPPSASRRYACAFGIENKGYVGTGVGASGYLNDFWEYDAVLNTWTQKTSFPGAPRYECTAFTIGSRGYIGCGAFAGTIYNDFYEYDPATDSWTQKANYPGTAGDAAAGFSLGNKGYIGIGSTQGSFPVDFYEWDQVTDTWTQKAPFPAPGRGFGTGFAVNGKGYFGLGEGGTYFNDFWEYTPDTATSAIPLQEKNRYRPSVILKNNRIEIRDADSGSNLIIFDASGKNIFTEKIQNVNQSFQLSAPAGIYFYSIRTGTANYNGKLLME